MLAYTVSLLLIIAIGVGYFAQIRNRTAARDDRLTSSQDKVAFEPRIPIETSGLPQMFESLKPWGANASLEEVAAAWRGVGRQKIEQIDQALARPELDDMERVSLQLLKSCVLNFDNKAIESYEVLTQRAAR